MAGSYNKITIIGNVGRDPEMRAVEGDGPRRFVVRDTRDRDMLSMAQREEGAVVV